MPPLESAQSIRSAVTHPQKRFSAGLPNARNVSGILGVLAIFGVSMPTQGEANASNFPHGKAAVKSVEDLKQAAAGRRAEIDQVKKDLDAAKTPAEKRAVLESFRSEQEAVRAEKMRSTPPSKSVEETISEMKSRAAGNPEMTQRAAQMEARLSEVQRVKLSLEKIRASEGEERLALMSEFQNERKVVLEKQKAERDTRAGQESLHANAVDVKALPPEMRAMREKAEERKREVEDLQAALKQADAKEKSALLAAFRAKQDAARAARVESLKTQAPTKSQP